MFDFLKSKKQKLMEQGQRADTCAGVLRIQIEFDDSPGYHDKLHTLYSYGYMFGFSDGLLITRKVDKDSDRLGEIAATFIFLFSKERGLKIFDHCLANQSNEPFVRGRLCGGTEATEWRNTRGDVVPMGLVEYLST
jgi:hypothetical protein